MCLCFGTPGRSIAAASRCVFFFLFFTRAKILRNRVYRRFLGVLFSLGVLIDWTFHMGGEPPQNIQRERTFSLREQIDLQV